MLRAGKWTAVLLIALWGGGAFAEEEKAAEKFHGRWYATASTGNLHSYRNESEHRINTELNLPAGLLFPDWHPPTSFKSWSRDMKLWEGHFGIGRTLSPHWAWTATLGGGIASIGNYHRVHLLGVLPVGSTVVFTSQVGMIETSIGYYPWKMPDFANAPKDRNMVVRRLLAARPFIEGYLGYFVLGSFNHVNFRLPPIGKILNVDVNEAAHLTYASPRLGLDIPLTKNDSAQVTLGYVFFSDHAKEYNMYGTYFSLRHMF